MTERRRGALERFARWLGADPVLAADLAQEALVKLWRAPPTAGDERTVEAWLRRVVRNRFLTLRARGRPGVPLDDEVLLEAAWRAFARDDGGDGRLAALEDCLPELSSRAREALQLHYRHGLPLAELGRSLGLTAAGARRLLQRARAALGTCIEARLDASPPHPEPTRDPR